MGAYGGRVVGVFQAAADSGDTQTYYTSGQTQPEYLSAVSMAVLRGRMVTLFHAMPLSSPPVDT